MSNDEKQKTGSAVTSQAQAGDARSNRLEKMGQFAVGDWRLASEEQKNKLNNLPRNQRRHQEKIVKKSIAIATANMVAESKTGAGYPIDQLLREFSFELNNRQLTHGLRTMPTSFNVVEAFLDYKINYPANFFSLLPERDHLYSMEDFLDFATSADNQSQHLSTLSGLPENIIYNYTPIGDARDLAFLHADSGRFVIAGFAMVRRANELSWMLIGGPICDLAAETERLKSHYNSETEFEWSKEKQFIPRGSMADVKAEPLQGTSDVWKTIVAGRFNIATEKHDVRYIFKDLGVYRDVKTDDPDIYGVASIDTLPLDKREQLESLQTELDKQSLLFQIAETLFKLPAYFNYRVTLIRDTRRETQMSSLAPKQVAALSATSLREKPRFKVVSSLEIIDTGATPILRAYSPPQYKVEVNGFWRRIDPETFGKGPDGSPVKGRTWIKGHMRWRDRPEKLTPIYIKSSVSAARAKAAAVHASNTNTTAADQSIEAVFDKFEETAPAQSGYVYVMRCPLMDDDVYKVWWSSREPKVRADELSKATGVPLAFIVVESWFVKSPRDVEKQAHILLAPYRINQRREFFKTSYETLRKNVAPIIAAHELQK